MTHKDKHGNKTVCCKGCSKIFKGSHTRMVAHFNPDDASVETCPAATAEVLDEMSKHIHELETKAEAAKKQRELAERTQADRTIARQQRVSDMCNKYSGNEVDDQSKSPRCLDSYSTRDDPNAWQVKRSLIMQPSMCCSCVCYARRMYHAHLTFDAGRMRVQLLLVSPTICTLQL